MAKKTTAPVSSRKPLSAAASKRLKDRDRKTLGKITALARHVATTAHKGW